MESTSIFHGCQSRALPAGALSSSRRYLGHAVVARPISVLPRGLGMAMALGDRTSRARAAVDFLGLRCRGGVRPLIRVASGESLAVRLQVTVAGRPRRMGVFCPAASHHVPSRRMSTYRAISENAPAAPEVASTGSWSESSAILRTCATTTPGREQGRCRSRTETMARPFPVRGGGNGWRAVARTRGRSLQRGSPR
jgi:hypothetical protein